jgi:hypothetical protein
VRRVEEKRERQVVASVGDSRNNGREETCKGERRGPTGAGVVVIEQGGVA